jgi:hypothetical protein
MNKTVITVLVIIAAAVIVALTISGKSTPTAPAEAPIAPEAQAPAPITEPAAEGQSLGEKMLQESGQSAEGSVATAPKAPEGVDAASDVAATVVEGVKSAGEPAPADAASPAAPVQGQ